MNKSQRILVMVVLSLLVVVSVSISCGDDKPSHEVAKEAISEYLEQRTGGRFSGMWTGNDDQSYEILGKWLSLDNLQKVEVVKIGTGRDFTPDSKLWPVRVYLTWPNGKLEEEFRVYKNAFGEWEALR